MRYLLFFILVALFSNRSFAQVSRDSVSAKNLKETFITHPYFNFDGAPERFAIGTRETHGDEGVFYFILSLVFYIALMRLIFFKYMSTMFTLFFRATLRQQQLREQMLQAPLPALLMNIFFVAVMATYCALLASYFDLQTADNFWTALMYAAAVIAAIYLGKFIILKLAGWVFGITSVSDTYIFIVFLINKMTSVFLLPVIILMAFPTPYLFPVVLMLSYVLVTSMFLYRFIISYRPVRSEIKLSRLHFFLYICAFEIAPLLLIYKVLLTFEVSSF